MQTIKRVMAAAGGLSVAFLAACSDSPTQPSAPVVRNVAPPSFALLAQPTNNPNGPNTITVCSAVAGATFNVTFDNQLGVIQAPPLSGSFPNYTLTLAANACATIWSKPGTTPGTDPATNVTVTQTGQAAGYQFQMVEIGKGDPSQTVTADNLTKTAQLQGNAFHGSTATFTQQLIPVEPQVCDFSTFGGFTLENNYNISYGGNAGKVDEGFAYGDLNFVNHDTGDQIHVWNVTGYGHPASGPLSNYPDSRFASGKGEINGSGSFDVEFRFVDLGEPGTSDRVWLKVNGNVLIQEQVVQGGNIQLHSVCKKAPKAEKH